MVVGTADRLAELLRGGSLKPGALEYLIFDGVERLATSAKAQTALEKFQALAAASAPGGHSVTTIAVLSPEAEGGAKGVVNAEAAARGLVGKGALKLSVDLTSELVPTSLHLVRSCGRLQQKCTLIYPFLPDVSVPRSAVC